MSTLTALPRIGSDHTPLILDTGARRVTSPKPFRFEKWWLDQPDFKDLVCEIWKSVVPGKCALDTWMNKTKILRKKNERLEHQCGGWYEKKEEGHEIRG